MGFGTNKDVSLATLGGGAAVERFDYELERVLQNIADHNTNATAVREVTLTVKIKPNEDRSFSVVDINAKSKLAAMKPAVTSIHLSEGLNGVVQATEFNPQQQTIFNREG